MTADGAGYGYEICPWFSGDIINGKYRDGRPVPECITKRWKEIDRERAGGKNEMIEHIFEEIRAERRRQDKKLGEQNHPMLGVNELSDYKNEQFPSRVSLENALARVWKRNKTDMFGWYDILIEEICEAFIENKPEKQREEMVRVAAVAVAIIECLDRRMGNDGKN